MKSKEEILIEKPCFEYSTMENRYYEWSDILDAMEEYAQQQVKNLNKPAVIKSAFKCDDVELQPIECEKWRGCFDCPHYKAVL